MAVASLRTHTDAILAKLVATTVLVGDGIKPQAGGWVDEPGESLFRPYMILYPLTATFDGTMYNPSDDADLEYQVTCVAETREQAEWVADQAIAALVEQTVTITGRSTLQRIQLIDAGGARRDDSVSPSVFIATPRFSLYTTP